MADKSINELPVAPKLTNEGLMVVYQDSQTNSIKGQTIANFARESAAADVQRAVDAANAAETSAQEAADKATEAKNVATKPPYINTTTGTWWIWNETNSTYVDSTVDATMSFTVGTVTTGDPGTEATITNVGTDTDPVLNFVIPKGDTGAPGGVVSFNGRNGVVNPEANDYDVSDIEGLSEALASKVPNWSTTNSFPANAVCAHAGKIWTNTSGAPSTGVTPGTDYSVWNVPYSNRNLLDNWDFRNPINQRGANSYSTIGFSFDGCRILSSGASVTINPGISVTFAAGASESDFAFAVEYMTAETYTLSASVIARSGTVNFFGVGCTNSGTEITLASGIHAGNVTPDSSRTVYFYLRLAVGASITIKCIKLERGSISTLANDPPAKYENESHDCKRMFERLGTGLTAIANSPTEIYVFGQFEVEKRITPVISLNTTSLLIHGLQVNSDATSTGSSITNIGVTTKGIKYCRIAGFSGLTVGGVYAISSDYLDVSSDL